MCIFRSIIGSYYGHDPKQFQQLLNGPYQSVNLDLKKRGCYQLRTIYVNYTDRLMFVTTKHESKSHFSIIEDKMGKNGGENLSRLSLDSV